jgi:hypothetical protein
VLLQIFDKFNYELEDPEKQVRISTLAEVYYQMLRHEILSKEIDTSIIENRILATSEGFQAKDIFNVLSVTTKKEVIDHLVPITKLLCS